MVDRLNGKKVVGIKQALKAIKSEKGKVVYIAKDAEKKLVNPVIELIKEYPSLRTEYIENMKELGKLCGIEVGAAIAVVLED